MKRPFKCVLADFSVLTMFLVLFLFVFPRPSGDIVPKAMIRFPPSKDQLMGAKEGRLQRMSSRLAETWSNSEGRTVASA